MKKLIFSFLLIITGFGYTHTPTLVNNNEIKDQPAVEMLDTSEENVDPLESFNRAIFNFNTMVDKNILIPIATEYENETTPVIKTGIGNFFENLADVPTFFNQVLQFKIGASFHSLMRVITNTTIGLGGLFDVATPMNFEKGDEDFGQTLGFYGVGNGPYLILPILGPSSLRDIANFYVDKKFSAEEVFNIDLNNRESITTTIISGIDTRAELLPTTNLIYDSSDPYIKMRSAYLQNIDYKIDDGNPSLDDVDF